MKYITVFEKRKKYVEVKRESPLRLLDDSNQYGYICSLIIDGCKTTRIDLIKKEQLKQFKKEYLDV